MTEPIAWIITAIALIVAFLVYYFLSKSKF